MWNSSKNLGKFIFKLGHLRLCGIHKKTWENSYLKYLGETNGHKWGHRINIGSYKRGNCGGEEEKLREALQSVIILSYRNTKSNCCGLSNKKRPYIDVGYRHYYRLPLHTPTRDILPICSQNVRLE